MKTKREKKTGRQRPNTLNEYKPGIEEQYKYLTDSVCYLSRQTNKKLTNRRKSDILRFSYKNKH